MPEKVPAKLSLIVGLGNPGEDYADTRHNAGFRFLARLAARQHQTLRLEPRFHSEVASVTLAEQPVRLLAPMTFMNCSGDAVFGFVRYYKLPIEGLLLVYDDIDLPPGTVRLKRGGGDGGHNGVRDVIEKLGGGDFLRLRLGVGHPGHRDEVVHYVLKRPPKSEQALIDAAIDDAIDVLPQIALGEIERGMNVLHSR